MIVKIIPGKASKSKTAHRRGFVNLLQYHDRKQSELVHTEKILGATPVELADYFDEIAARGTRVKEPVFHAVISFAPDELNPAPATIREIAGRYLQQLGYEHQPWVMYRHDDKQHIHYHIVSCRVDIRTGRGIDSSFEGRRSVKILRELAPIYGYQVGRGNDKRKNMEIVEQITPDRTDGIENTQEATPRQQTPDLENTAPHTRFMNKGLVEQIDQIIREVLVNDQPYSMYRFIQACRGRGIVVQKVRRGYVVKLGTNYPIALSKLPAFAEKRLSHILRANQQFRRQQMRYISASIRQALHSLPSLDMQYETAAELFALKLSSLLSAADINVIYNTNTSGIAGVSFEHSGVTVKGSEMKLSWETILQTLRQKKTTQTAPATLKHPTQTPNNRYRTLIAGAGVGKRMSEDEEEKKRKEGVKEIE